MTYVCAVGLRGLKWKGSARRECEVFGIISRWFLGRSSSLVSKKVKD